MQQFMGLKVITLISALFLVAGCGGGGGGSSDDSIVSIDFSLDEVFHEHNWPHSVLFPERHNGRNAAAKARASAADDWFSSLSCQRSGSCSSSPPHAGSTCRHS